MKFETFDEYLHYKHAEQNPEVLDDMLPDDYLRWLEDIGVDGIIDYANKWGLTIMDYCIGILEKPIKGA